MKFRRLTKRRVQISAFFLVSACSWHAFGFEHLIYRYELAVGKGVDVCEAMLKTYNAKFTKPWTSKETPTGDSVRTGFWKTIYSRVPTSPEYDEIQWRFHHYTWNNVEQPVLYGEFDADNDGQKDLVVKTGFFYGSPGTWDYFEIYPPSSIDFAAWRTRADYDKDIAPKRRALIGYPVHQRPFIFRGSTYFSGYVFTPREARSANPAEPFAPPEFLVIRKYLGAPAANAVEQEKTSSMNTICKYNMLQSIRK